MAKSKSNTGKTLGIIYAVVHFIIAVFALYLSFKCNNGFKVWPTLSSVFFPYIYLVYLFATNKDCLLNFGKTPEPIKLA